MTDTLFPPDRKGAPTPEEIQAAREELRRRLPELRQLPGFPNGSDEDILQMSLPPYYTACPNPFITDWLKALELDGYGEEPYEDPGPYASDISVGKSHPIYKAHSYPTKVPHQAIMRYILHYTRPGDLVLDGFCGTGMTGVAAQACGNPERAIKDEIEAEFAKEGRKPYWGARRAILQDLSPSATFIAAGLNLPIDADAFDRASKEILERFEAEWGWMYGTTHTDGKTKVKIDYTVWSEVFTCPHCGGEVVFYDAAFDEATMQVRPEFACPVCGAQVDKDALERRLLRIADPISGQQLLSQNFTPVRVVYRVGKSVLTKHLGEEDREVLARVGRIADPGLAPHHEIPYMHETHERHSFPAYGISHMHQFWPARARLALSAMWHMSEEVESTDVRLGLLFWVEQALWGLSWMNRYKPTDHSQVNRQQSGVYYLPSLMSECSIRYNLQGSNPAKGKRESLVKTWSASPVRQGSAIISTASSTQLSLPDDSVDYVFVDPPFGANISYADLAYLLESWHRVTMNVDEEAIVTRNKHRPKQLPDYQELMEACFREHYRVLKPGRWMTVEFNNSSNRVWLAIQEALSVAGFVVADTRVFDKQQLTYVQTTGKNVVKRDLIISAYRPENEAEERFSIVAGTVDGAWAFVRDHLRHLPVVDRKQPGGAVRERQADRLYDRMVAYHIHRGVTVPLTAGEFYTGVDQRFPYRDGMYFLNEQLEAYERERMTAAGGVEEQLFITSESSAVQWLRRLLRGKSLPFDEIRTPFFRELQAGLPDWEDLPDLKVLLQENFLQDEANRWYVPDPTKGSDLEKLRTRALLKEFETYLAGKGKLDRLRSEAVRVGFKDAWAKRAFGLIVQVGDRLPEDVFADDPQLLYYYDNAKRLRG